MDASRPVTDLRGLSPGWSLAARSVPVVALAAVALLPLLPRHAAKVSATRVPSFYTSTAVDSIPPGSVVLTYPYPDQAGNQVFNFETYVGLQPNNVLLDQAMAGMRYDLMGGFGWFPVPGGRNGTYNAPTLAPASVQTLFDVGLTRHETAAQRSVLSTSDLTHDLRVFLRRYDVQTVVVSPHAGNPASVVSHLTEAIGRPVEEGGVTVWFDVGQRLSHVG